jgi:hypothetical protein
MVKLYWRNVNLFFAELLTRLSEPPVFSAKPVLTRLDDFDYNTFRCS